ncbi:hypothetical protein [Brachybacterium sp. YJGR34]|uniref:hypothetical protein n=1 Tax=Brachybacterium sp. YJGR34 TaxID=2059911 RepID=UPI000E0A0CD2|nr:hypothetical protein [Brachybacterium sp. YJGR34]
MIRRPSRLYRAFKPTPAGLFEVVSGDTIYTDDQIQSITITHGSDGPHPSVTPSTAEVRLTGALNIVRNDPFTVRTTPAFGTALAYGDIPGGHVRQRFNGRKALSEIDDERWSRSGTPARWATTVTASSWTSLLRNTSRRHNFSTGTRSASAVVTALRHPDIEALQPVTYSYLLNFDRIATAGSSMTFDDAMRTFATDLHTLVQHQRSGTVRVISNVQRRNDLDPGGPVWTLLRAHTLSPARWKTDSEVATTQYRVHYSIDGGTYEMEWPLGDEVSVIPLQEETVDLTQVFRDTDSIPLIMNAKNYATNISRMAVESVTLDLGLLWRRGTPSTLRTIGEALRLEAGDPMYLGADWPEGVRGPYFANQISESITPDRWTITFRLQHARNVLGLPDFALPTPPAITWDANSSTWDAAPGTWDDYA